jgi:hypothetical protein
MPLFVEVCENRLEQADAHLADAEAADRGIENAAQRPLIDGQGLRSEMAA